MTSSEDLEEENEVALPQKRPPRPSRDTYTKPSTLDVLRYLAQAPEIRRIAASLPARGPGAVGRPDAFPAVIHIIFGTMAWQCGSKRKAEVELSDPAAWDILKDALATDFPEKHCFHPDFEHKKYRPNRYAYARFRNKHSANDPAWEGAWATALDEAAAQAEAMGLMDRTTGSLTHMARTNLVAGDGTVIPPRTRKSPTDRQMTPFGAVGCRHEPDAKHFMTGTGKRVLGTKWVALMAHTGHEDERVVLGLLNQPHAADGGEAAIALRLIEAARERLPGMQGVVWDKALRGIHIDWLYRLGLQSVVKVARTKGGEPRTKNLGTHPARRGPMHVGDVEVFAVGGAPGIRVPVRGKKHWVRCKKMKVSEESNRDGTVRAYGVYRIPSESPVPRSLRGATFRVRYNSGQRADPKENVAESVRPVAEGDDEWDDLYHPRPGTESFNSWLKDMLPSGLAPSFTAKRQRFDFLGSQLYGNARAKIAFNARMERERIASTKAA